MVRNVVLYWVVLATQLSNSQKLGHNCHEVVRGLVGNNVGLGDRLEELTP